MADYSVLFADITGLFNFTVKEAIKRSRPFRIRDFITAISKSEKCSVVTQRIKQLQARATSAEHELDFMKFVISVAHEAMPMSVTAFQGVIKKANLGGVVIVRKILNFSSKRIGDKVFYDYPRCSQPWFIYKMKNEIHDMLADSETESDETQGDENLRYEPILNKLTEETVETGIVLNDTPWGATYSTNLKIFRSRENNYFAVTSGYNMEMKSEPCTVVIDYFKRWKTSNLPTLYMEGDFVAFQEDRALSVLFELLDLVYSNSPVPIDKNVIRLQLKKD